MSQPAANCSISLWQSSFIYCSTPGGQPGNNSFSNFVVHRASDGDTSQPNAWRYDAPVIKTFSPASGNTNGSTLFPVGGLNFGITPFVQFDSTKLTPQPGSTQALLTFYAPRLS